MTKLFIKKAFITNIEVSMTDTFKVTQENPAGKIRVFLTNGKIYELSFNTNEKLETFIGVCTNGRLTSNDFFIRVHDYCESHKICPIK